MSVDPLAGAAAGNADLAALVDAELAQLAADAQALRALLVEDAVVTARVLPSNGLTDLLEIAGRRVAASLPPNVRPGDVLQVRVTGFDGERILLQIVGTGADAAVESGPPNLPVAPPPGAFVPSTIQPAPGTPAPYAPTPGTPYPTPASSPYPAPGHTSYPPPSNTPAGSSGAVPTRGGAPSGATPAAPNASAQFAGAVLRANVTSTSGTGGDASAAVAAAREALAAATERLIPSPGSAGTANTTANPVTEAPATGATATNANAEATPNGAGSAAAAAHSPDAVTTQRPGASADPPTSIEARLAAARASIANATANSTRGTFAPNAPTASRSAAPPPPQSSFVAPPQIETAVGLDAAVRRTAQPEFITSRSAWPSAPPTQPASSAPAQPVSRTSGLAAYAEPVALLRALRLPVTPSNVSAATLALQRPDKLPSALAALERALPRASDDPHIATLRTLLPFVGRIDPASPRLAAQIAAYVDHVVDGAEPKLATLLAAARATVPPEAAAPAVAAASPAPTTPANAAASPSAANTAATNTAATNTPAPTASATAGNNAAAAANNASAAAATPASDALPLPAAVAVERAAALGVDLKQTLLALAADRAAPVGLAPSVAGALTALTAVQVSAAQTLAAHPDGIAFTIPLTTAHGFANAQISVKRDAPDGRGAPVDAENFRIAFVLETANYGTVAIDLVTVGREVTVDVRTEAAPAMRAFRDALGQLTTRLESLRYRVSSAGASVGTTTTIAVDAPPSRPADPDATVDRSA